MNSFSEFPGSLIPEWADVEELKRKLKGLNCENGEKYGLTENLLLENFIYDTIFEQTCTFAPKILRPLLYGEIHHVLLRNINGNIFACT